MISSNCDEDGDGAVIFKSISPANGGAGVKVEWILKSRFVFSK